MSTAELNPSLPFDATEHESAPITGADFLSPETFPRDENGLVDIDVYQDYLIDHPDEVPVQVVGGQGSGFIHQHLYFWRNFYRQKGEPDLLRDKTLSAFWEAPYNQLLMRSYKERQVHDRFKGLVSPPPIETMKKALIDFGNLDYLGAAALGRRVSMVPEAIEYLVPGVNPPKASAFLSPKETADLFDKEVEKILDNLKQPLVTPQRVVTGAISRMARMIRSERLTEEVRQRLIEDPVHYPVRIKKLNDLYGISNNLLNKICSIRLVPSEPVPID